MTDDDDAVADQRAFCAGFRAGLAHARRWRPLTSDEATWPEQGAYVAMVRAGEPSLFRSGRILGDACERMLEHGWTHWMPLPLPPPSEEVGDAYRTPDRIDAHRLKRLLIPVTEAQAAAWRRAAEREGMTVAAWVRETCDAAGAHAKSKAPAALSRRTTGAG